MEPRFQEPADFIWGSLQNDDGAKIRYGRLKPTGEPKGTMVMVPGFREPIEKYFETMRDMTARGYDVFIMDWRGQGGSERYLPNEPQKPFSLGFDRDIRDLHKFINDIVKPADDQKIVLCAHSMGGHLGLRYAKEHPDTFDCMITTAPMFEIETSVFPRPVAKRMVQFAKTGRILEKFMPGGSEWQPGKKKYADNHLCSDPLRWQAQEAAMEQKPELRVGDATYGWLYHAFASIEILNKEDYLKEIKIPVLMATPQADVIVDIKAQVRASGIMPDCTRVDLPGAKHEVWMEKDEHRNVWLKAVDDFLGRHMGLARTAENDNAAKKVKTPKPKIAP